MGNKKLRVWLPLIFSIVMIIGMYFGYKLNDQAGGNKNFFGNNKRGALQEALDLIRLKYVDPLPLDSLESSAIEEMMSRLDPHSVYFPPVELKEANEDLAGNFEGIGIEFNVFLDTVNVVYVIPDGPSDKAGLQIGDKIVKVGDISLTPSPETERIRELIRGEKGSKVVLQIKRGATVQPFTITRGKIPVPSVDAAYMINATTGYIRLTKFTESSYEEFMQALERLQKEGLKQLMIDLRGNGGGFMNEAVDMADEFLDQDKLVVYTEGTHSKKREYRSRRPGLFEQGKLILLVDESSASASEVLAGALQDWCRAKIIGRRTFGKGLVQEQYDLSDGAAIRLTVARYYTPRGRSIQRSYEKGTKIYLDEIRDRFEHGDINNLDSSLRLNGKMFTTVCGDTVYGGGGITPDVIVPVDTSGFRRSISRMIIDGRFNSYVYNFYLEHRNEMDQYKNVNDYMTRFNKAEELWAGLVSFAKKDSINLNDISASEKGALQKRLRASLARYKWRNLGFYQILNAQDPVIIRALREF